MCCNKIPWIGIMILSMLALFAGCSKSKNPTVKKPEISKPLPSKVDTADIFKEFYSEDAEKKSPSKNATGKTSGKIAKTAKNQTFSPSSSASTSTVDFSENGKYVVQISCVKSQKFADKMADGLKDKGYPAYAAEVQNPTPSLSGAYYRVRIGGFKTISIAKAFGENTLSPNGYQYWVDKKSNDKVGLEGSGLGSGAANTNPAASYESAAPAPAAPSSTSSSAPASSFPSSSSSAAAPEAPAAKTAAANPGFGSPSPSVAPASSPATSPAAPTTQPSSAPSAPAQPSAGGKSSTTGSGDWASDSSASGSGW